MASIEKVLSTRITKRIEGNFISPLSELLNAEGERMVQIIQAVEAFQKLGAKERDDHKNIAAHKSRMREQLNGAWMKPEKKLFSEEFATLITSFEPIFASLDEWITLPQREERFKRIEQDSRSLAVAKFFKRSFLVLGQWPQRLSSNFDKEKTPFWEHHIALRNLAKRHYEAEFIHKVRPLTEVLIRELNDQYLKIKIWEHQLVDDSKSHAKSLASASQMLKEVTAFKESTLTQIEEKLVDVVAQCQKAFAYEYERAGTVELSNSKLRERVIQKQITHADQKWAQHNKVWRNATYALLEEWRSDLDLYILRSKTLAELGDFKSAQLRKVVEYIDPEINQIKAFIEESSESLAAKKENRLKELKVINYQASKKLDKELVPRLCDKLSSLDITNLINKLEVTIRQNVEELSDEHVIVKDDVYDQPIKSDDLTSISPYELIAFETLSEFQEELKHIKTELFVALERTTAASTDLDHIITFSFSSAISAIEEETQNEEEAVAVAQEGLRRALNRLNENRQALEDAMQKNGVLLEEVVHGFCEKVMELTVNENVGELRLRITKAKAAKQAEEVKRQLNEKIRARWKSAASGIKTGYQRSIKFVSYIGEKFILTASKPTLSKEVSDFLLESRMAIEKLPLIYQRLYQIEPLKDLELFEGRQKEVQAFKEAYDSWKQGRYAATAVLGEKWGGLTTFLNFTIKETRFQQSVIRYAFKENVENPEKFFALMKEVLKNDRLDSLDEIARFLNEGSKKVIILEDLQNMYLRRVNGFSSLQLLCELITRTYKNVFWVTSTTLYTWSYLNKTINIGEYFSYTIEMGNLTSEQIVNIIWKRNRISGFNIRFEPTADQLNDKKFSKLTDREQQAELKEEFFEGLNAFAKSNISLALIFWLLSTIEVDQSTITIGKFNKPNLNFLKVLSMNKLHALHALILHDGLSSSQLSQVLNVTESSATMLLLALEEDGIVFAKKEAYMVNSFVYRDTISLLKSRNLIH